jgi:hypothetical protein
MGDGETITALDANGYIIREYDDVALTRPTIFSRNANGSIKLRRMAKGALATVISISEHTQAEMKCKVLDLEACDSNHFSFELPEHVVFARSSEEKLASGSVG